MSNPSVAPTVRAAVFAVVCTLLAIGAHLPMTAAEVPFPVVALGAAAVFGVARAAAGRERGLGAITALVGGCQFGLHLVFDVFQRVPGATPMPSTTSGAPMTSMASMPAMTSPTSLRDPMAALSMASTAAADPAAAHAAHAAPMGLSTGMTLAHGIAALVAAWWLRQGEAAVFAGVRWTAAVVRASWQGLAGLLAGAVVVVGVPAAFRRGGDVPLAGLRSRLIRFVVIGRGPPAVSAS